MTLLKIIPKKVWIGIALLFAGAIMMGTAFTKGSEHGEQKCQIASQKAYEKDLEESLSTLQKDLERALERQRAGEESIQELNSKYISVKKDKSKLKQALDDAINNPPNCNKLDPRYYELYKSMYNKEAP